MNKFLLFVLNHPLVKIFLTIVTYFIFPFQNEKQQLPQPLTPKKPTKTIKKNDATIKNNESNDFYEPELDNSDISSVKSIPSSTNSPINKNSLFPSTIANNEILTNSSCKPCSTSVSTKLMPFKNNQGEIEWTFTDDSSMHSFNNEFISNNISPTISNSSSNNESILSNNINNQYPTSYNNSIKAESKGYEDNGISDSHTPKSLNTPSPSSSNGELKSHQCPHCEATFKLRGYLTRHLKKHSIKKAYSCPFHQFSIYIDENNITHKCHPTGGFSRRDTYKTHLKSRHFKYPKGTKTKERAKSSGNCSMCDEFFPNSEIWCEVHIEGGECKFLPQGFKGKSRIKNRLKKELKKKGYNINTDESIDYSKLVSEISKLSQEAFNLELFPKDDGEDSGSPYSSSDVSQSPVSETGGSHQIMHQNSSPVNHIPIARPTSQPQQVQQPHYHIPQPQYHQPQPIHQHSVIQDQHSISRPISTTTSIPLQVQQQQDFMSSLFDGDNFYYKILDYDDEFCLDVDQLNQFTPNSLSPELPVHNKMNSLQQQYQAMQNQLQMNLMMYQQQSQNHEQYQEQHPPQQTQQQAQQQNRYPQQGQQNFYQYQTQEGFNTMNTGLNVDEVHLDSNYLQPQYVQY